VYGAAKHAFGRPAARFAAAAVLLECLLFGALAASASGHAIAAVVGFVPHLPASARRIAVDDFSTTIAVFAVGFAWWRLRQGRLWPGRTATALVWSVLGAIVGLTVWGLIHAVRLGAGPVTLANFATRQPLLVWLVAGATSLFVAGNSEALGRAAPDVPQPKIGHLHRAAFVVNAMSLLVAVGIALVFVAVVPPHEQDVRSSAPIAAIAAFTLPHSIVVVIGTLIGAGAVAFLCFAVYRSATNAQQLLLRLAEDGVLAPASRTLHPRFGTPSRLINLVALGQLILLVAAAGQVEWLATAYVVLLAVVALVKIAALIRLRRMRPEARAYRVPLNFLLAGREWPGGLAAIATVVGLACLVLVGSGDAAALAGAGLLTAVALTLGLLERAQHAAQLDPQISTDIELLPTPAVGLADAKARPNNLLVAVRKPGVLGHLAAALDAPGDHDVVVMTVRIVGIDASDDRLLDPSPTADEIRLLREAALLAERQDRTVSMVVVPAANVFDAVAETVVGLQSSEVYVGESETLTADQQARLLGEAWERTPGHERFPVRLIIQHSSGRAAAYHLGPHAPSFTPEDFRLIHTLWLDLTKTIGPHIHHHDVVRAALNLMEEQLNTPGSQRDAAVAAVRQTARPADELSAVVRQRDFTRLRDMVRNRTASDLAALWTELPLEDQVVGFRVLPRKLAAAIFEYLSQEAQESLLKAMAQEDVAALLNNMAPDDRTMFLEELPATATQQLLALLTPEQRSVAATLLGYPEHSIGRLMTPDYIAIREDWTVQQVLDYVRTHGQDSETLNVLYVVDEDGVLIDDIRIREFLLTSLAGKVSDLMDRRFVALSASADQGQAVAVFRKEDRSALPVIDSAGVLIGIVTIDDVLDVAEAAATKEIQRIGGSEALDEPYMKVGFVQMIQKRAGWLTALFLGEMLTATAMGFFEHEIERAVVLALFVPLIISSGGNSGSQASTLVIRAIALGEVHLWDWWRVMRREIQAGLALGGILGTIGFLRITIWSAFSTIYGEHWLLVASTVAIALVGVVLWGTLIGSLLPFLLRRLGFDPATSSAPFVATLVDVTGLVIYFSVGLVILRGTLL
jgi:magnesium transporter